MAARGEWTPERRQKMSDCKKAQWAEWREARKVLARLAEAEAENAGLKALCSRLIAVCESQKAEIAMLRSTVDESRDPADGDYAQAYQTRQMPASEASLTFLRQLKAARGQ